MADDFDGSILSDENVDGFMSGSGDDKPLADEIREAAYLEEIAEIARLKEALRSKYKTLAGQTLTTEARDRGYEILDRRLAVTKAMYRGEPMPEFDSLEPIEQEAQEPEQGKLLPWPKGARLHPFIRPKAKSKGSGNWRDSPRQVARRAGYKHYWSGKKCVHGHDSARFVSTSQCLTCLHDWTANRRAKKKARLAEA